MKKIYKREEYLKKIRGFYDDTMIKVITGIRRCGKSYFLESVMEELIAKGIPEKDIIYIELDKKGYKNITKPQKLEEVIDKKITDNDFKYLFIDEVENVKGFEKVINEFFDKDAEVIFYSNDGEKEVYTVGDLCPYPFGSSDLK